MLELRHLLQTMRLALQSREPLFYALSYRGEPERSAL
jgi:hypothetical protein